MLRFKAWAALEDGEKSSLAKISWKRPASFCPLRRRWNSPARLVACEPVRCLLVIGRRIAHTREGISAVTRSPTQAVGAAFADVAWR